MSARSPSLLIGYRWIPCAFDLRCLMIARPWWHRDADKFERFGPNVPILERCANRDVDGYACEKSCDFLFCLVASPNLTTTL